MYIHLKHRGKIELLTTFFEIATCAVFKNRPSIKVLLEATVLIYESKDLN
jgi:hypothetical protein